MKNDSGEMDGRPPSYTVENAQWPVREGNEDIMRMDGPDLDGRDPLSPRSGFNLKS
jgi:hypothetical protein